MIRVFTLDGRTMTTREALHDTMEACFRLPEHYGRNLDALFDCLSERVGGCVALCHAEAMPKELRGPLIALFLDLAEEGSWSFSLSAGSSPCFYTEG